MESQSFKERVSSLLQKSRKAVRLYASMSRHSNDGNAQFAELQIQQWHHTNHELVRELTKILEENSQKKVVNSIFELRDRFFDVWKETETLLHRRHKELLSATENGDYIKSAVCAQEAVTYKAKMQAAQAAHHELTQVIERSKVSETRPIKLKNEAIQEYSVPLLVAASGGGKVIPFQARR